MTRSASPSWASRSGAWGLLEVPELVEVTADRVVPPIDPDSSVTAVDLPTSQWEPGDEAAAAEIRGRLTLDASGCVRVGDLHAVWPRGWTAWVAEGRLVLLDPEGTIAAVEGDQIEAGGGYYGPEAGEACAQTNEVASVMSNVEVVAPPD